MDLILSNYRRRNELCRTDVQHGTLGESVLKSPPTEAQQLAAFGLDNSASTYASGANLVLGQVLPKFVNDLQADAAIRSSILGAFSVFGTERSWQMTGPFLPVSELVAPELFQSASSPICTRIIEKIKLLAAQRKLVSRVLNVDQRHAWLVDINDGQPTDMEYHAEARKYTQEFAVENGIEVHLFGMGAQANMDFLQSIAQPGRPAEPLSSDKDFATIFNWLKNSFAITSRSQAGEIVEIESISGRLIRTE